MTSAAALLACLAVAWAVRARTGGTAAAVAWPVVEGDAFPRTVRLPGGEAIALPAPPRRILLASATVVDFATALVGPDRVAGVCEHAFTASSLALAPGAWEHLPRHARFLAETTLAAAPDLVLCSDYNDPGTLAALGRAGLAVVPLPGAESLEDTLRGLAVVARLLGAESEGTRVRADLDRRIAALRARGPAAPLRALCFTHNPTGTWTGGARTLHDVALLLAGLRNAAAEAGIDGHKPIAVEVVLQIDPDVLVVDAPVPGALGSRAQLAAHPALSRLRAVQRGALIELHPALYATGSHHVVTAAEAIAGRIDALDLREAPR